MVCIAYQSLVYVFNTNHASFTGCICSLWRRLAFSSSNTECTDIKRSRVPSDFSLESSRNKMTAEPRIEKIDLSKDIYIYSESAKAHAAALKYLKKCLTIVHRWGQHKSNSEAERTQFCKHEKGLIVVLKDPRLLL